MISDGVIAILIGAIVQRLALVEFDQKTLSHFLRLRSRGNIAIETIKQEFFEDRLKELPLITYLSGAMNGLSVVFIINNHIFSWVLTFLSVPLFFYTNYVAIRHFYRKLKKI